MIPAHHTETKSRPPRKAVLPSGDYKEIRPIRVGSSSGAREHTRASLKGNSRQTALVRTLSRVATSIRMTAVRRATSVSNTASVPPLLGYLENVVDTSWMIADDILTGKIALGSLRSARHPLLRHVMTKRGELPVTSWAPAQPSMVLSFDVLCI